MRSARLTLPPLPPGFSVILIGLECLTTRIVLQAFIEADLNVSLACLPGRASMPLLKTRKRRSLPLAGRAAAAPTVTSLAQTADIELWRIGDFDAPQVQAELQAIPAGLVVVACYHRRIPAAVYAQRLYGGVNLHPSLLPDKRGPDPLFWIFHDNDARAGATVHRLTDRFDAGDILTQTSFDKPDGISEEELETRLAQVGARALLETMARFAQGNVVAVPQRDGDASWARQPRPADFHLDASASAQRAANFFRGVAARGQPITVDVEDRTRVVLDVAGWTAGPEKPVEAPEVCTALAFAEGWLVVRLAG